MAVSLVYETHSIALDNERGFATGWLPGELSEAGREAARALGERRRNDGLDCVFASDLRRAVETAEIAFAGSDLEVREEARLRECNYGELNGAPVERLEPRTRFVDEPFPGGQSYRECVEEMRAFLGDVATEFDGRRVLVIAHSAQRWALKHLLEGVPLEEAIEVGNSVEYGLSASIYTQDVNKAFTAMREMYTGIFYVNAPTIGAETHLPFGGTKGTGNGHREAGQAALDVFTEWKSVYVDYSGTLQRAQIDNQ